MPRAGPRTLDGALSEHETEELLSLELDWRHSGPGAVHAELPKDVRFRIANRMQRVFSERLGLRATGVYGHLKRFFRPCGVHCDGAGPDFTYLVALEVVGHRPEDSQTIVFEQSWPGGPAIFERSPPAVLDNAAASEPVSAARMRSEVVGRVPSFVNPGLLPHVEAEVLEGLSIAEACVWEPGRLLVFPRERLHASGYFPTGRKTFLQGGGRLQ